MSALDGRIGAVILGLAAGIETGLLAFLTTRYFGLRSFGTLYGILFGGFGLGAAVSPALYGWVYDRFGDYGPALWTAAIVFGVAALLLLLLGPYSVRPDGVAPQTDIFLSGETSGGPATSIGRVAAAVDSN